ncbi:MAG: DUF222 domain-containing protein [Actinomycetota bacterium]
MFDSNYAELTADEAAAEFARLERERRRVDAEVIALLDAVDRSQVFRADGHFSARIMMRLHGHLSGPEASQRDRVMRCLRDLPEIAQAYADGGVGTDQVRRIAAVWANQRVREQLIACESVFLESAQRMEFVEFDGFCEQWTNLVDADGAHDAAKRRWRRRRVSVDQDLNGFWSLDGRLMSSDGADLREVLDEMAGALRLADVEAAKEAHGDEWRRHLPRTMAQLRHDAFVELVNRGASVGPDGRPVERTLNRVIDDATYEHHLALLVGAEPEPLDPTDPHRISRTADGTYVNPAELVARSLVDHVRRMVVDAAGVVIDLGRRSRLFTGNARDAALLSEVRCYWTGCWVPATGCQIDHLLPWEREGRTHPGNGAPACGTHNRIKQQGFHTWRDTSGAWHLARPDGTPVPDHRTHWPPEGGAALGNVA